jgi:glycine betaine/proline transport system substrate-binding protein
MGVTDLSFHRVTASLIENILLRFGFCVNKIYSKHEDNFEKLASGEVDLLCSAWLPFNHGIYKYKIEETVPLIELGLHYEPYALWGVPDYVPADKVSEITDLLKPIVLQRMNKNIQGINIGAGITRFSLKMMDEYKLSKAGYIFNTGTEAQCFAAIENAITRKEWIIIPLWKPQYLHHEYNIRELKEPRGLLGSVDKAILLLREDRKNLFSENEIFILDSVRFNNEIIAGLDYEVSKKKKELDRVTKEFFKLNKY